MATLGSILMLLASLISLVTGIWLIVIAAQQKKYLWIVLMILVPFAALVFVVLNWSETKKPFFISLAAIPLFLGGLAMGIGGAMSEAQMSMVTASNQRPTVHVEPTAPEPEPAPAAPEPAPLPLPRTPAPKPAPRVTEPPRVALPEPSPAPTAETRPASPAEPKPDAAATPLPTLAARSVAPVTAASIQVDFVRIITASQGFLHSVRLRIVNPSSRAVVKVTMLVGYLDRSGRELRSWVTEHADPEKPELVAANATREFDCPAFFMPDTTTSAYVRVREVKFADGSTWRPE